MHFSGPETEGSLQNCYIQALITYQEVLTDTNETRLGLQVD